MVDKRADVESELLERFKAGLYQVMTERRMKLNPLIEEYKLPSTLRFVMRGKNCNVTTIEETARALGVDVYELLCVKPKDFKKAPVPKGRHGKRGSVQGEKSAA